MSILEKRSLAGRGGVASGLMRKVVDSLESVAGGRAPSRVVSYRLRDAELQDKRWARALNTQSYWELVISQFGYWDKAEQRKALQELWDNGGVKIITARNMRVGLLHVEQRADCLWIGDIQIAPRWRGRGFAGAVVTDLLAQARRLNLPVKLRVHQMNIRAKKFYDRLGFAFIEEDADHVYMRLD